MSIFHLSAKSVSRSAGRSVTAAAAYRSAEKIVDQRTGEVHDYARKSGVLATELIMPGGQSLGRDSFWNAVEMHHKRGDAVLAREVEIALPKELTDAQRTALATDFARQLATHYSVAADVAIHAPHRLSKAERKRAAADVEDNGNYHAHILLSACSVSAEGKLGKKAAELDPIHCQRAKIANLADTARPLWADIANRALEQAGHSARIDHRSLEAQGIKRVPQQHLGPAAFGYERRTGESSRVRRERALDADRRIAYAASLSSRADAQIIDLSTQLRDAIAERDSARRRLVVAPVLGGGLLAQPPRVRKDAGDASALPLPPRYHSPAPPPSPGLGGGLLGGSSLAQPPNYHRSTPALGGGLLDLPLPPGYRKAAKADADPGQASGTPSAEKSPVGPFTAPLALPPGYHGVADDKPKQRGPRGPR